MKLSLPAIALKRPITVIMLAITVLGLGIIAGYRIPIEFLPSFDPPFLACSIPYIGANPEQVENEVAIPAEGQFRTIPKLKRISTTSGSNGCMVSMLFDWDADMTTVMAEVRDRIERLKLELPDDIERVVIQRYSTDSFPIMFFAIGGEGDEEELAHLARTELKSRLMRIDGVAGADVNGLPARDVLIEFDQNALRSINLGLYDIIGKLRTTSLNMSLGEMTEADTKYLVRAVDEFSTPEQLAEIIIGPNGLRLKDVAHVGYRPREESSRFGIDGKRSVVVAVRKESEANTIATCRKVRELLDRLPGDPTFQNTSVFMFFDQSEVILAALSGLLRSGKFGGGLAVVVLFLFLHRVRPTLAVAMAIPASLVAGFVFMFFSGMTLNLVTVVSMIVVLGMLVDNSIVVIENIQRYNQLGYSLADSARMGASGVALAITSATLTTVVVFVPIVYMNTGMLSTYFTQFAGPITVSLIASLVIALTVIPLAVSRMKSHRTFRASSIVHPDDDNGAVAPRRPSGRLAILARLQPLRRIMVFYAGCLGWVARWRVATLLIMFAVFLVTMLVPVPKLFMQGEPEQDTRQVRIDVEFDQNFGMERASGTFDRLGAIIDDYRDELAIENVFFSHDANAGQFLAFLAKAEDMAPGETLPYTTQEVRDILRERLPEKVPGAELRFSTGQASQKATSGFTLFLRGDDPTTLNAYAERLRYIVKNNIEGVTQVLTDAERARQEMQVHINEALADDHGVSSMNIAQSVDFALRGVRLSQLKQGGREIPVWAQFREEDRRTRSNLENVSLFGADGTLVPLNQLVDLVKARSARTINRVNGKNVVTLTAESSREDLGNVLDDLKILFEQFSLPRGYSIDFGDELMDLAEGLPDFKLGLLLAAILVFLVMGALFESYLLPLSILTTVPLAAVGVAWGLYLTGSPMDAVCMIGCILLVGLVVNNGIVIVDHINQLRKQGMSRYDAVVQAGHDRFRPVMMTALTTILGCVPLAVGSSSGANEFASLGRALIGGLTTGTLLTLFVVPLFYTIIDDFQAWLFEYISNLAGIIGLGKGAKAAAGSK
jgi:hydrophobic/amphiphilic exporter-1 (mainly G- bacteria), HAE1 family